jgi:undecaprenyl-diphosphatase
MTWYEALVLGVIQGLAEFLPISSSAHLALAPRFLGWRDQGLAFDVALHVGTLVALAAYFWRDWLHLLHSAVKVARCRRAVHVDEWRVVYLVVATIPAALAGLTVQDLAESAFRSPRLIAVTLASMGIVLWLVDRAAPRDRQLPSMRLRDALLVGLAQVLALVPGVSRSGATITGARLCGFDRQSAAVFSFLMSFPITLAAAAVKAPEAVREGHAILPLAVGVGAAALSSWLAIAALLRFVVRHSYGIFAAYRLALAVVVWVVLGWKG